MKKLVACIITLAMIATFFGCSLTGSTEKDYMDVLALQQVDPCWNDYVCTGASEVMGPTSCGVFAMINAVRYLTGETPDPRELADAFSEVGAFTAGAGTDPWIAFAEDGPAEKYLEENNIPVKIKTYWSECRYLSDVDIYLNDGCTIAFHVQGHFMACVAKDDETGKYLILDSAVVNPKRSNNSLGGTWYDASYFSKGGSMPMTGITVFQRNDGENVPEHELPPTDNSVNIKYCTLLVDSTGTMGTAKFEGTAGNAVAAEVGSTIRLYVKPKLGYICTGIDVGGQYIKMLNDGKAAVYEFEQPETITQVSVYFSTK